MGPRQFGGGKNMHFLWTARDGDASSGGNPSAADGPGDAPREPPGPEAYAKGRSGAGKWLVPIAGAIGVLLVVGFLMYLSRLNELNTLEREVSTLRAQSESADRNADVRAELERQAARIEGLATRLDVMIDARDAVVKLRRELSRQSAELATMAVRLNRLEQDSGPAAPSTAARDDRDPPPANAPESRPVEPAPGRWTINLVSVADPESARQVERRLDELGVESRIDEVEMDRRSLRRIVVPGFGSYGEAKTAASRLRQQLGLSEEPWISRD